MFYVGDEEMVKEAGFSVLVGKRDYNNGRSPDWQSHGLLNTETIGGKPQLQPLPFMVMDLGC